jgi:ADP-dependent NAD(P)H-hydrate dehydratase / NAD(P)H-hydrate epimerase
VTVRAVTAAEAAERDRAAITAGVPSRALMQRAGAAAAAELVRHCGDRLERGVAVFAGVGNNGGDAWVVAAALAAVGIRVRVEEVGDAKTDDARAERDNARRQTSFDRPTGAEGVVVDGVLGTGATGVPRGAAAGAIRRIMALRDSGARVVALDVPSGLDASTGDAELAVTADLTVMFGTAKRGALVRRDLCGYVVVVDIGLGIHADRGDAAPVLIDGAWVRTRVPPIVPNAHKGTRRRVAIVGGTVGMAGAAILAARAALRSGVGMARAVVDAASVAAVQTSVPAALTRTWPESDDEIRDVICEWAHAVVIGPGLGRAAGTRARIERILQLWKGPVVLDADALTLFERDGSALAALLGGRPAVITPHVVEFARLAGAEPGDVIRGAFDVGREMARHVGCVVLLKGVPTVLTAADGRTLVSAAGTPALGTGGSGDVLAGVAATLVAQMGDPLEAAACAAWVHGRAGELVSERAVRGATIDDVIDALPAVWSEPAPPPRPPVLAELAAIRAQRRDEPR